MVGPSPTMNLNQLVEGDIFEIIGLTNLPEDKKESTMALLIEAVQNRVILRIDDLIMKSEKNTWMQVLETEDDEIIKNFLTEKNIDIKNLTMQESLLLKNQLVNLRHVS